MKNDYIVTKIGIVDADSGHDQYVLVQRSDGEELTIEEARDYLLPLVYCEGKQPGAYYCNTVWCSMVQYSNYTAICAIQHRYDI